MASWFRFAPRCPSCGLAFEREGDSFLGAYVVNLAITEGLLAVALMAYILRAVDRPGTPLLPVLLGAGVIAVGAPLLFFPFSRTIWAAIELAVNPPPPEEPSADGPGQ